MNELQLGGPAFADEADGDGWSVGGEVKPQDWGIEEGDAFNWAIISRNKLYRYVLARAWDPMIPTMVWVMLNPSTADATNDDPTIRKCIGFAKRHGCGGILVVNLFAYRATDPRELAKVADPVGPYNLDAIRWATKFPETSTVVAGWGRFPTVGVRRLAHQSGALAAARPKALRRFGSTQDDEPRHPLMLAYTTPLEKAAGVLDAAGAESGKP